MELVIAFTGLMVFLGLTMFLGELVYKAWTKKDRQKELEDFNNEHLGI